MAQVRKRKPLLRRSQQLMVKGPKGYKRVLVPGKLLKKIEERDNPLVPVIEDGIPLPSLFERLMLSGRHKYPLQFMKPGQSFLVPAGSTTLAALKVHLKAAANVLGFEFFVGPVEGGFRVWRAQ